MRNYKSLPKKYVKMFIAAGGFCGKLETVCVSGNYIIRVTRVSGHRDYVWRCPEDVILDCTFDGRVETELIPDKYLVCRTEPLN